MPYTVYLKKNEEKRLLGGHCWVYANEVARIEGKDKNGALADVRAADGRYIGSGYINHASKILVRIFIRSENEIPGRNPTREKANAENGKDGTAPTVGEETLGEEKGKTANGFFDEEALYRRRIAEAWEYRRRLGYENCCRVVFGEADNLPALIVDKYADVLCVQCLSLGIHRRKETIVRVLAEIFSPRGIYERSDAAVLAKEGLPPEKGTLYGEVPDEVIIEENGLKMSVDVKNGQKTGYFLDQKENRFALRRYAANGRVLDCFCNSGGFSLNAALSADEVTAVDISPLALENVKRNAALNGITNLSVRCGDAFSVLREYKAAGEKFRLVVLDPPAFCKSADEVKDAYRGYKDVNILGMKLTEKGGYLATCSCSHYMTPMLFEKMLAEAARESGRRVRCLETRSQAPDHPALINETETRYLKFYILQVM